MKIRVPGHMNKYGKEAVIIDMTTNLRGKLLMRLECDITH